MTTRFALLLFLLPLLLRAAPEPPPADIVPFAGLSPQDACDKATLPRGFKMHVFASEPDIVQPIAFALDHRGRVWLAEGRTYPRRKGDPPFVYHASRSRTRRSTPCVA